MSTKHSNQTFVVITRRYIAQFYEWNRIYSENFNIEVLKEKLYMRGNKVNE